MLANNRVSRFGGAAFILGSLLFLANKLDEMSRLFLSRSMPDVISGEDVLLILIGQVFSIMGFLAYFRVYGPRTRRFGKSSLLLFCGGGILLAVAHIAFMPLGRTLPLDPFLFVILGLAAMLIGLILFGIANLRQPILSRWQWLPLATGLIGFAGFFLFSGEQLSSVFLALRTLFALGLVGLGLTLSLETPARAEAAA